MGADFTYLTVPRVEMTPERKEQLIALIDTLTLEDFDERYDFDDEDDEGNPIGIDDEKDFLKTIIENYNDFDQRRDTSDISSNGIWKYITGGMSWGDAPTDAYDLFDHIVNCPPLYDTLLKIAREDMELHREDARYNTEE